MEESHLFIEFPGRYPENELIRLADRILRDENQFLPVNIILSSDARLHELNRQFRGKDSPTDVLSFPIDPDLEILGEIYISVETATRQAPEFNNDLENELCRLVCHGALHLCGYDHHNSADEKLMQEKEHYYLGET